MRGSADRVYLDFAAGAPVVPAAAEAMTAVLTLPGNPSSLHTSGRRARRVVEDARDQLAEALGAQATEVVFTSGGTEADNLAVLGAWRARRGERPKVVVSAVEHPAVAECTREVGDGWRVVGVDAAGRLDVDALAAALDERTALASVLWVNNETGVVQPVADMVQAAHSVGAWAHSDAVQALGHVPLSFANSGLDLLSVSAHKVGGPVGVGALLVRREVTLAPVGFGGGQERRLRSGTVPAALAAGFAAAAASAVASLDAERARLTALHTQLVDGVVTRVPDVRINGGGEVSPHIVNIAFPGCRADDLLLLLDAEGIDCSTGSACTAGVHQPSEVLAAMGLPEELCRASLRLSFGPTTSQEDVQRLVAVLPSAVEAARRASS